MKGIEEIHSDQVMFDDNRTLTEIMKEVLNKLQTIEAQTVSEGSEEDEENI